MTVFLVEGVGFKSVRFAATTHVRIVGLHQRLEPMPNIGRLPALLPAVPCERCGGKEKQRNHMPHAALLGERAASNRPTLRSAGPR
jgi:hypothetical protein